MENKSMADPIVVHESPLPSSAATLLRYVLTAIGGLLVSRGYFDEALLNDVIGAVLIIAPAAYGVYRTVFNKRQLVIAATAAPNAVAMVKASP